MGRVDEALRRAAEASVRAQERAEHSAGVVDTDFPAETAPAWSGMTWRLSPWVASERRWRPRATCLGSLGTNQWGGSLFEPRRRPEEGRPAVHFSAKLVGDDRMLTTSREQYRRLAATLHRIQATSGLKVVMIASAVAGEGKTLTAANLALTFSESYEQNVLLIDADLRRPSLARTFGVPSSPGLSDGLLPRRPTPAAAPACVGPARRFFRPASPRPIRWPA